jgi:hypothetical protein
MRKTRLIIVAALALAASAAAQAQFYVGGNVGLGRTDVDCSGVDDCDKNAVGFKAYGGYLFDAGWAVEALYFDWGKVTASGNLAAVGLPATVLSGSIESSGFGIGLAYFLPVPGDWSGVFRFGAVQNRSKLDISDGSLATGETNSKVFTYVGLGLGYRLTPQFTVTAEADFSRAQWGLGGTYESNNVQLYSVGLRYAF